jgi:hypothetical protein
MKLSQQRIWILILLTWNIMDWFWNECCFKLCIKISHVWKVHIVTTYIPRAPPLVQRRLEHKLTTHRHVASWSVIILNPYVSYGIMLCTRLSVRSVWPVHKVTIKLFRRYSRSLAPISWSRDEEASAPSVCSGLWPLPAACTIRLPVAANSELRAN